VRPRRARGRAAGLRALTAGLVATAALATGAGGATAATRLVSEPSVNVSTSGSITFAWTGEPARGCAAAGQCGISGAIEILAGGSFGEGGGRISPATVPLEFTDGNAAARVLEQPASGGAPVSCSDLVPVDFSFGVRHRGGHAYAAIRRFNSFEMPSSGRCPGPTGADLAAVRLPARRLGRYGYDLSGRATFGAGPFTVTVVSSLRARVTSGRGSFGTVSGPPRPGTRPRLRRAYLEHATVVYRIEAASGWLQTTFAGLTAPLCQPLGACGTSGSIGQTLRGAGTITFTAQRTVAHPLSVRAILADLAAGRLHPLFLTSRARLALQVAATVTRADATTCRDAADEPVALQDAFPESSHSLMVGLSPTSGFGPFGPTSVDPFRTRCAGPSTVDVVGRPFAPLAQAPVAPAQLGAGPVTLRFARARGFADSAYAGRMNGALELALERTRVSAGTRPVRVLAPAPRGTAAG
jgi:hypothetical protein